MHSLLKIFEHVDFPIAMIHVSLAKYNYTFPKISHSIPLGSRTW